MSASIVERLENRRLLTTWYVAPWGDDSHAGTNINQPLATLEGVGYQAGPGDQILLRGGTYQWDNSQWFGAEGSAINWITIDNYGNEQVILDGSNMVVPASDPGQSHVIVIDGKYVEIRDMEIRNSPEDGVAIWEAHDVRVRNMYFHHNGGSGVSARSAPFSFETYNVLIENNVVYRNIQANSDTAGDVVWGGAIISHYADNVIIRNNTVHENFGEGIIQVVSTGGSVIGNDVRDNFSVNIYLDNAVDVTVENNFAHHTFMSEFLRFDKPATVVTRRATRALSPHPGRT